MDKTELEKKGTDLNVIMERIKTTNALAEVIEVKGALHTLILQWNKQLEEMVTLQKQYANVKGRVSKLEDRQRELENLFDDYIEPQIMEPKELQIQPGKPLKK